MLQITCSCGRQLKVKDEFAGKKVRCPDCSCVLRVLALPVESELLDIPEGHQQSVSNKAAVIWKGLGSTFAGFWRQKDHPIQLDLSQSNWPPADESTPDDCSEVPREAPNPQYEAMFITPKIQEKGASLPGLVNRKRLSSRRVETQWICPYCDGPISEEAQKCRHCGEFLTDTGHSDFLAGCLGFFLGPVGLWYKGQWAAGFAWIAAWFFIFMPVVFFTAGLGIVLVPFLWIGMAIHAAAAKPIR